MDKKANWSSGIGMFGVLGALGAMLGGASRGDAHKTPEELKSERDKWMKQAELAQVALLDLAACLSESRRQCSKLQEEARLQNLSSEALIKQNTEMVGKVTELKAQIALLEGAYRVER